MGKQAKLFLEGAGDAFYTRNRDKPRLPDPVLLAIETCAITPKTVLELGCGNGWRLAEIQKLYKPTHCAGYEPSEQAVKEKVYENVFRASATILQKIAAGYYTLIIFGFCLYLVDREDVMLIASHADRVLKDGGHIVIHDFFPEFPYRNPYKHREGVFSFKMNYANLWLCNPSYTLSYLGLSGEDDDRVGVAVLQKNAESAFPLRQT